MSTDAKEYELSLKIFINKEKTKVLFAEAGSDFADVLLSFMMLPLGRIVKILEKHYGDNAPTIGSLTTLYKGLTNPDTANLWTQYGKELLDNPRSVFDFSNLKVRVDDSHPSRNNFGKSYSEVFTQISTSFLFSDDLRVVPDVTGSILHTLDKLGIDVMDTQGTVEWLLFGNTCVNNIDNLYKSITGLIYYPKTKGTDSIQQLLNPGVCNLYESVNIVHRSTDLCGCYYFGAYWEQNVVTGSGHRMYMVTEDLTVTHLSMSSTLPLLNQMKISLSDVEEVEFSVGKKELLSILKATLISNRALTDGLINPKLKEQPIPQV
ncbi:hypothetical protein ACS0TY_030249 [Phlomoides rotata]